MGWAWKDREHFHHWREKWRQKEGWGPNATGGVSRVFAHSKRLGLAEAMVLTLAMYSNHLSSLSKDLGLMSSYSDFMGLSDWSHH